MFKNLLVLCLIFVSTSAFAKVLVVSDVDDTLKNSHVLDRTDMVLNAYDTRLLLRGMPKLLHRIVNENNATMAYLTNAPKKLMSGSHRKFLKRHKFPIAPIFFKDEDPSSTHKLNRLREFLEIGRAHV